MASDWLGAQAGRLQADLERATGASQSTVSKWMRYERRPVKSEYVQGLAALFGKTYDEVAGAIKRTPLKPGGAKSVKAQLADALAENEELREEVTRLRERLQAGQ